MDRPTLEPYRQRAAWALAAAVVVALVGAIALLRSSTQSGADQQVAVPSLATSQVAPVASPAGVPAPDDAAPVIPGPTLAAEPSPPPLDATQADRARLVEALNRTQAEAPVTFQPEGIRLTAAGEQSLRRVIGLLRDAPSVRVRVVGHSAVVPREPATALRVSKARAEAVMVAMRAGGIAAERIELVALGDTRPLATAAASRRVEISVI